MWSTGTVHSIFFWGNVNASGAHQATHGYVD